MGLDTITSWAIVGLFFLGLAVLVLRDLTVKRAPGPLAVVYVLAVWPMIVNINTPRYVTYDRYTGRGSMSLPEWQESLSTPAWFLTGLLALYVLGRLLSRGWMRIPPHGLRLFVAYLLFVSAVIVAALLGNPGGGLTHALFRPHVLISAVVLAEAQRSGEVLRAAKLGSLAWIVASLAAAMVAPDWAMFESGPMLDGPLPFPRLYGVSTHPNALAPIALVFLYLEYYIPSRRAVRFVGSALAVVALVMTQSKTSWAIAAVNACVLFVYRKGASGPTRFWGKAATGALAALVVLGATVSFGDGSARNVDAKTLTGRTELWSVAMDAWASSPIFGYGPTLWSEGFRAQFLTTEASYAGHSHNAYVQQLAESGVVGFGLLLVFLGVLARTAWRARYTSRGLSMALLLDVLIAGVTESKLGPRSMGDTMFAAATLLALMMACSCGKEEQATAPRLTAAPGTRSNPITAPAA